MRSIWAVAVNTVKQALRLKIAAVFIVLLILLLPVMGFKMTGDGTLKGRMQAFISYSLSLTGLLLALLTIFTAAYTLTKDIKDKQIYTVITKPIRRFQYILGKLFGVILLDAGLLSLFAIIIYSITSLMPVFMHADAEQIAQLHNEFFTARASVKPQQPDISQELDEAYNKLKKQGEVPAGVDENPAARHNYRKELARRIGLRRRAAVVGEELVMEFKDVKVKEPNQALFIRYKYDVAVNPADLSIYSRWVAGDVRQFNLAAPLDTPLYSTDRKDLIRTFREFAIPADSVARDGYFALAFQNVPLNNTVVMFPLEDGIELLYKADTFTLNFIRVVFIIFVRLVFLAALAIFAGSFLSFPVAILLCLAVFTMANMSGYIGESYNVVGGQPNSLYSYILKPFIMLLPAFDQLTAAEYLVPGRLLSWPVFAWHGFAVLFLKSLPLAIMSLLVFSFREIAKVIV